MNLLLILLGKLLSALSRFFNAGYGSTWPGHIALSVNKSFIEDLLKNNSQLKIILIAGTNGKTTTGKLIQTILEKSGKRVFQNESGANLLNGIASSMLLRNNIFCKINYDFAILEIDENTLPFILREIRVPDFIIILNLFRDQLDRYGEVNIIAKKWADAIRHLPSGSKFILNADDPQIASLGFVRNDHISKAIPIPYRKRGSDEVFYFGLEDKKLASANFQHASDSTYCSNCGNKLSYSSVFYSHLGIWKCLSCKNTRPKLDINESSIYPLPGVYNRYNILAAILLCKQLHIEQKIIDAALKDFKPAFGRQEILDVNGKRVQIFLSKNPTSFNESLRTVQSLGGKNLLIVLNDRIPDGRDVSWIWDVDFEEFIDSFKKITVSGDRAYDMALRLKYASQNSNVKTQNYNSKFKTYEELKKAVKTALEKPPKTETLYILPTYSAMLEVRKILTGKKIL